MGFVGSRNLRLDHALETVRADAVAELRLRVLRDVNFHLLPIVPVLTNTLAVATNGQKAFQSSHVRERCFQFTDVRG